jgi:hypothetical protein
MKGKIIALTTKHRKEDAIAQPFLEHLGARLIIAEIDTDELGTFSGEIERKDSPLETAIKKARLGMESTTLPYGLASEGSFGPHPFIPFLPCDSELMVYIDDKLGFTLHETLISEETNYAHACIENEKQARDFLELAKFPSHGIIIRPNNCFDKNYIYKEIATDSDFLYAFNQSKAVSTDGKVWLETDMRAHRNPTRMNVIHQLAKKLAKRLATLCPSCNAPGWGKIGSETSLKCEYCNQPTEMISHEIYGCVLCAHTDKSPRTDDLKVAPQMYCSWCNP